MRKLHFDGHDVACFAGQGCLYIRVYPPFPEDEDKEKQEVIYTLKIKGNIP